LIMAAVAVFGGATGAVLLSLRARHGTDMGGFLQGVLLTLGLLIVLAANSAVTAMLAGWLAPSRLWSSAACFTIIEAMLLLLVLPILKVIASAFVLTDAATGEGSFSFFWFGRLMEDQTLRFLVNGIALACLATLLSIILAVPLAVLRARFRFPGQAVLGVAVLVPLILPPFVGALSMKSLLGQYGSLNILLSNIGLFSMRNAPDWLAGGLGSVAVLQALHLFPIMYLNASAALANIDPAHIQAARNLGAGPWRTFFSVTLPLMRPGLFAGGTIVFIWSFTDIGTPLILDYRNLLPVEIFSRLTSADYGGKTFAQVVVLLTLSVLMYVLGKFIFGRDSGATGGKATIQAETARLGVRGTIGAWLLFGGVLLLALIPHIGVVLLSTSDHWINTILPARYTTAHLRDVVRSPATYRSIINSCRYAGASVSLDLVVGAAAAWLLVRTRAAGRTLMDTLVMLPLAVPGIILAAGYVSLTAPGTWFESIGPGGDPFLILVIAYSVRRMPFVVRGVGAGLQQVPESLEEAARNLGSTRRSAALRITLPLIAANIIAAAVLTFTFTMLEVSDSLVLAQRAADYPITKQIYDLFTSGTQDSNNLAAALGVYGMILLGGTMGVASLLLGKKLGAIFRA
ncbi:MAG: iron ABC transporter permease, partial [Phycisphaerae bacterium]|nr:iron ABC transporter permease [Phycisphaerae bacterium]